MSSQNDEQTEKVAQDGGINHKAVLELNVNLRTEVDANSENVMTFLKSIGDLSKSKKE